MREYPRIWEAAEKIVYSATLQEAVTSRTRIERIFDPEALRDMKATFTGDLSTGGANLSAHAFGAGLVDECRLYVSPVAVGSGKKALRHNVRLSLELPDERRFAGGTVYPRYRVMP